MAAAGESPPLQSQKAWAAGLMATGYQGLPGVKRLASKYKGRLGGNGGEHDHGNKA